MKCGQFMRACEEYLDLHRDPSPRLPARLAEHVQTCRRCQSRWQTTVRARGLLALLRPEGELAPDPDFLARVRARIRDRQMRRRWMAMRVAWRDLVIALVLFVSAAGLFTYNLRRTEQPNMGEAMALDVPHINPEHPADSHQKPQAADVLLNLMNP